jgi:hypothetical protein
MEENRRRMIWVLLGEFYPAFCISNSRYNPTSPILVLPEATDKMSPEAEAAKLYFESLQLLSNQELEKEIETLKLKKSTESEAAHQFNQPNALANKEIFEYWSKAAYWTLDEFVALILGRNPKVVYAVAVANDKHHSQFGMKFKETMVLAERALAMGKIFQKTSPQVLCGWAKNLLIEIPEELQSAVESRKTGLTDWKKAYDDLAISHVNLQNEILKFKLKLDLFLAREKLNKPIGEREKDSLLKLIIGMAIGGYSYNPQAGRSGSHKEISDDLIKIGLTLSDDTVRKYLREGAELLPPQEKG